MAVRTNRTASCLVLTASFGLTFISFGMAKSFSVMYSTLRESFGSSAADTSWVASLNTGLMLIIGPVAGVLESRFGCRFVAVMGSVLIGTGLVGSAFVSSLYWLYLTYGVISGVGFGMDFLVANVAVNLHFQKHRSVSIAIASAGEGCGNIVIPWLTTLCVDYYGWRGAFLLLAGVGLQGVLFGLILFNIGTQKIKRMRPEGLEGNAISLRQEVATVMTNKSFLVFASSGIFVVIAYFVPFVMMPDLAMTKGISRTDATLSITVAGGASIVGRILIAMVVDVVSADRVWTLILAILLGGAATICCSLFKTTWLFIVYGIILGTFTGTFGFLMPLITNDIVGKYHMGIGFGLILLFHGIGAMIGMPLAGWMTDLTTNYDLSFIIAGAMFCIGALLMCFLKSGNCCSSPDDSSGDRAGEDVSRDLLSEDLVIKVTETTFE